MTDEYDDRMLSPFPSSTDARPEAAEARRANDELASKRILCHFCLHGRCMPTWPADRWVRTEDGDVLPSCRVHSGEGENIPFDQGCREFIAKRVLES